MKTTITAINCYLVTLICCLAAPALSVETIGAVRFVGIDKGEQYGAGLGVSLALNKHVALTGRALSYSDNDWRGSVVDEAGAGVEATLLRLGGLRLAAVAGVNYSFDSDDIGVGAGGKASLDIYGPLYTFGGAEWRFWDKQESDLHVTAGIGLRF